MSSEYKLGIEDFAGVHTVGIAGNKGAGKTLALVKLAELVAQGRGRALLIDPAGIIDWDEKAQEIGTELGALELEKWDGKAVKATAKLLLSEGLSAISLRLSSRAQAVIAVNDISNLVLKAGSKGVPIPIFVDEVQEVAPQPEAKIFTAHYLISLFKLGRNYRITPVAFASQRLSSVTKNLVGLADVLIAGRLTYYRDGNALAEWFGVESYTTKHRLNKKLKALKPGEFLAFGLREQIVKLKFTEAGIMEQVRWKA